MLGRRGEFEGVADWLPVLLQSRPRPAMLLPSSGGHNRLNTAAVYDPQQPVTPTTLSVTLRPDSIQQLSMIRSNL